MRIQSVVNTNEGLQITYIEEADIDTQTGVMTARVLDIPHAVLPQDMLDELIDDVEQIIDHVRVLQRRPVDSFRAPR